MSDRRPIGFFDSGLGGISVLREVRKILPKEDYLYFGDSANAPYGTKSRGEIIALSDAVVQKLLARNVKAVVVACNTATGEAVDTLRLRYPELPIIGTEPAIKPAAEKYPGGRILILATPQCLRSRRVTELTARFRSQADIFSVPCEGLMEYVERAELSGKRLRQYLTDKLQPFLEQPISAVVLGCTHYPFVRGEIAALVGPDAEIIDGSHGIAAHLKAVLSVRGLLNEDGSGRVKFLNSSPDPGYPERCRRLLECEI